MIFSFDNFLWPTVIAYSDNGHILIFSTEAQLQSKCSFINRYGLIKDVTIFYKVVSLIHNTGENINNFHDSHWWDPSLLQGLFVPFARVGSDDPVRVLRLLHNKYTGYN